MITFMKWSKPAGSASLYRDDTVTQLDSDAATQQHSYRDTVTQWHSYRATQLQSGTPGGIVLFALAAR